MEDVTYSCVVAGCPAQFNRYGLSRHYKQSHAEELQASIGAVRATKG